MKTNRRNRLLVAIVLIVFISVSLFSTLFIVHHANHDCIGEHCTICMQIKSSSSYLKHLYSPSMFSTLLSCTMVFVITRLLQGKFKKLLSDLVSLGTRMNN